MNNVCLKDAVDRKMGIKRRQKEEIKNTSFHSPVLTLNVSFCSSFEVGHKPLLHLRENTPFLTATEMNSTRENSPNKHINNPLQTCTEKWING